MSFLLLASLCFAQDDPGGVKDSSSGELTTEDLLKVTGTPPLTIPKSSITSDTFKTRKVDWLKRVLLPAIKREAGAAAEEPKGTETIIKALEWWAVGLHHAELNSLVGQVSALVPADTRVPTLHFIIGAMESKLGRGPEAKSHWLLSMQQTDPAKGIAFPGAFSAAQVLISTPGGKKPDDESERRMFELLKAACDPSQCAVDDAPYLLDSVLNWIPSSFRRPRASGFIAFFRGCGLPEWVRQAIIGYCEVDEAWTQRGSGFASTVTPDGWKGWEKHLSAARAALTASWKARPDRPEAASLMIEVSMGGQAGDAATMRMWFDRAIAAQCDYEPAYTKLLWGLRPRWGGSHLQMLAFGVACAKTERHETEVPSQLLDSLLDIVSETEDWRPVFRNPQISKMVSATLKGRLPHLHDPERIRYHHGSTLVFGWMAGDYNLAAAGLAPIWTEGKVIDLPDSAKSICSALAIDITGMVSQTRALSTPFREAYERAETARQAGDYEDAIRINEEAASEATKELGLPKSQREILVFERDLHKGGWVKMPLGVRQWSKMYNSWAHTATTIQARTTGTNPAHMFFRGIPGSRFEVRGKVRFPEGPGARAAFHVIVGCPGEYVAMPARQWIQFVCSTEDYKTSEIRIGPSALVMRTAKPQPGPEIAREVPFRFRRDGNKVSWWVNEKAVVEDLKLPVDLPDGPCSFGLGARNYGAGNPVEFLELEMRLVRDEA